MDVKGFPCKALLTQLPLGFISIQLTGSTSKQEASGVEDTEW